MFEPRITFAREAKDAYELGIYTWREIITLVDRAGISTGGYCRETGTFEYVFTDNSKIIFWEETQTITIEEE